MTVPEGGRQNLNRVRQDLQPLEQQSAHTITLLRFPRAPVLVHANQLPLLLFHQSVRFKYEGKDLGQRNNLTLTIAYLPASIFIP